MKASFDGIRKRLAIQFNELVSTRPSPDQERILVEMRQTLGGLLCMYDPNDPEDCNDLSNDIRLSSVGDEEEDCTGCIHDGSGDQECMICQDGSRYEVRRRT